MKVFHYKRLHYVCILHVTLATSILEACDKLRDETLPNLGVRLEDKAGMRLIDGHQLKLWSIGRTVVKLVNPEELKLEMERDRQVSF